MKEQRRGKRIAMTPDEMDAFLQEQRTCHLASIGHDGSPHVSPLWFVWDGSAFWLTSVVKSQRWVNVMRDPRVSVMIDGGVDYFELCAVELTGSVEVVGEVPRTSAPDASVDVPERLFGAKYSGGAYQPDGKHAWLRLTPEKIVSWDFRKMKGA